MQRRYGFAIGVVAISALIGAPTWAQSRPKAPADFSGVWLAANISRQGEDKSQQSQWSSTPLPFTPKGLAAFLANKPGIGPRSFKPTEVNDPQLVANPNGLYRTLRYPRPMEIMQLPRKVIQLFGWGRIFRVIPLDRPVPDDVATGPFWYGYSVGHWDGSTLIVNTLALDGRAWLDEWGTPISDDARIEERWQRTAPDRLQLTLTVNDPTYYTRPWTSSPVIYRPQKEEPIEIIFAAMDEQAFHEGLFVPATSPAPAKAP